MLGDLNFRVRLPPNCVVERLAESVGEEKKALARLLLSGDGQQQPPPGSLTPSLAATASALSSLTAASTGSSGDSSFATVAVTHPSSSSALARPTRLARYQSAVPGLPLPPPFGSGVSLGRCSSDESDAGRTAAAAAAAAAAEGVEEEGEPLPFPSTASSNDTSAEEEGDLVLEMEMEEEETKQPEGALVIPAASPSKGCIDGPGYYHHQCPLEGEADEADEEEAEARRLREWWRWVHEHDELSRVMRAGACFHGFVEGPLCFPPSFRWVKGARADYTKEGAEAFEGCYTLIKASEGAKGLRPPSYTDRVLVCSLPDLAGDLAIEEYDVCEAMTGSDHRPISAALRLTVDASEGPSACLSRQASEPAAELKTRKLVVIFSDVRFVPLAKETTAAGASSSSSSLVSSPEEDGEEKEEGPARPWRQRLQGAFASTAGRGRSTAAHEPAAVPAAQVLSALVVHYPLSLEDPAALAAQRKAEELKAGFEQGFAMGRRERRQEKEAKAAAAVAAILDSEGGSELSDMEQGLPSHAAAAAAAAAGGCGAPLHHLDSIHMLSLKSGANGSSSSGGSGDGDRGAEADMPLSFRVAVHEGRGPGGDSGAAAGLPQYAVVRVQDRRKHEIGQGVLCLREALPRARMQEEQDEEGEGKEDEERGACLEASVCDGGRLVGRLLLRAEVLTEEEERRRHKRELQSRVGFLASATATIRGFAAAHGMAGSPVKKF